MLHVKSLPLVHNTHYYRPKMNLDVITDVIKIEAGLFLYSFLKADYNSKLFRYRITAYFGGEIFSGLSENGSIVIFAILIFAVTCQAHYSTK